MEELAFRTPMVVGRLRRHAHRLPQVARRVRLGHEHAPLPLGIEPSGGHHLDHRLWQPFGIYGQSPYGRRLQVGLLLSRLGPLGLKVSGARAALRHPGRDEYRLSVLGSITFGGARHAVPGRTAEADWW